MVFQEAFETLAKDSDLTGETWRILSYLFSKLNFENDIHLAQADIAKALEMRKQNVSRAMKLLCDKQIILKGPKVGRTVTYRLNAHYGWKGRVKNLDNVRKAQFRVIDGGKEPAAGIVRD
jgi:DNA-binding MarR family transcriptional regulator